MQDTEIQWLTSFAVNSIYLCIRHTGNFMRVRLSEICEVISGFTARGKLEESDGGSLAIQLRDVTEASAINPLTLMRLAFDGPKERYLAGAGDVVFRSRGERNTAARLGEDFVEPAVAVLPVLILRPTAEILPEYLVWAVNQPEAQRHFDTDARGATIRMIPRASIESLEIDLPDIATQKKVAEIDALSRREMELAIELVDVRRRLMARSLQAKIRNVPDKGRSGRK
jgi:hypothetical protein